MMKENEIEVATLGAGCFWCVEAVFQEVNGVTKVESGYMGGQTPDPTYREISSGMTGHAEVAQIWFDPSIVSFETILDVFWSTHDPTTLDRQGADRGTQYRSAIFYHSEVQKKSAEMSKANVATQLWSDPIVTEVVPATTYYSGEEYHQNFYRNNPSHGYCRAVINPKMAKFREKFSSKISSH